jgi:hypothetical protein
MCTVTWLREDDGYHLLCNRDEKRSRLLAEEPRQHTGAGGIAYVAPTDRERGGTWIAANEFSVTLCLLNGANLSSSGGLRAGRLSRGFVIPELLDCRSAAEAGARAMGLRLEEYSAFTLIGMDGNPETILMEWNGAESRLEANRNDAGLVTSSSLDGQKARMLREKLFEGMRLSGGGWDAAKLYHFHESHGEGDLAFSPCMHRSDAETVSFSWVQHFGGEIRLFYTPGAPCQWRSGESLQLPCRRSS